MRFKQCEEIENTKQSNLDMPTAQGILNAARECFLEKEYDKVAFRQITERTEVTSGSITYYFGSKDHLAARITAEYLEEGIQKMDSSAMSRLDSTKRFYTVVFLDWLIIDENPDFTRFYYSYNRSTPGLYQENGNTYTRLVRKLLDEYRLDVSERQNEIYLIVCWGNTRGLLLHRHEHPHPITRETVMDTITPNYFYDLGMSDKAIYQVIQNSETSLKKHYPHTFQEES